MAMISLFVYVLLALLSFLLIELNRKNASIQSLESILKITVEKQNLYVQTYQQIGDIITR
jgi:hypothetical protein